MIYVVNGDEFWDHRGDLGSADRRERRKLVIRNRDNAGRVMGLN